ncbi:MAG: adenosine deaminase [Pseudolabrys sp.]|nr:adenosine deaminase [Pseudolabrys sp.]MDP2297556.1 adenosine deaminase [Pseudolabrys sp.]
MRTPNLTKRHWRSAGIVLATVAFIAGLTGAVWLAAHWDTTVTAATLTQARANPAALRQFLARMPKGGDLHSHLSGAVYAERFVDWAIADGLCLRAADQTILNPPCPAGSVAMPEAMRDQGSRDRLVNALSMRGFVPSATGQTGHDHFFATFVRFNAVSSRHFADMVLDQLVTYQDQSAQYAELMVTFAGSGERRPFVDVIAGKTSFEDKLAALDQAGLSDFVQKRKAEFAAQLAAIEDRLACDAARTRPGCKMTFRFIAQVARNNSLDDVFVQTAIAAALARVDPAIVGFNFVQPEDAAIALKDYSAHMRIIAYLAAHPSGAKPVNVALHAGELWLGLVPPGDLTFHITEAVGIAGAKRIGHGVSLAFERDADKLLKTMRERGIAVEINLSSNDLVLGVRGNEHPLPAYRAAGVPVVLSTDDSGVERIDLTHEYVRAARDYRLGYKALKKMARASLMHSFLPDADKRKELERFDAAKKAFERSNAARVSILDGLLLIAGAAINPVSAAAR